LDWVADPPRREFQFRRPLFSPKGRTAFEFTAEQQVNVENKVSLLSKKIQDINEANNRSISGIVGGVLVIDTKILDLKISGALKKGVYCWDLRTLGLLCSKVFLVEALSQTETEPARIWEEKLDRWTTLIARLCPMYGYLDGRVVLLYQNPLDHLEVPSVASKLDNLHRIMVQKVSGLSGRTILKVYLHSASEIAEGGERALRSKLQVLSNNQIKYEVEGCRLVSHSMASWATQLDYSSIAFR